MLTYQLRAVQFSSCQCPLGGCCRPEALVLLCEFILNSTRSPPGEEFLYHILLELYLTGSLQDAPGSPPGVEANTTV